MATVAELELEQKTSEYIQYIRDFAANADKDFMFHGSKSSFTFSIFDKDVTLEFHI